MMRSRAARLFLSGSLAAVFTLLLISGCSKRNARNANEIVIGHVASLTGDTATFGVSTEEGIRLALDEVNAEGGVLGKKVIVLTEDDRSQSDEAKTAANKLITRDRVVALLGEISSSRSLAMAPEAQAVGVPMLSPGSTNPKVTESGDYIFRACFIDSFQGAAMANFAMDNLKLKRFAVLYPVNSDYGVGLRNYVSEAIKRKGGTIVSDVSYSEKSDVDFKGQLTKIKNADPEAVFVTGYYTEAGLIARQAKELGLSMPLLGGDGWDSDQLVKIGKEAMNGCYFSNHAAHDEDRPEIRNFVQAYKAKFKNSDGSPKTPDAMAILGYDSLKLMVDAIGRAGSTDGVKIRDALAATRNFPAASGNITMDKDRNADKPIVIIKVENGAFKYMTTVTHN